MAEAALLAGSAGATIAGGFAKARAQKQKAHAAEYEARSFDLRAKQVSADRRAELREALGAITLARASSGASLDSPTAMAIEAGVRSDSAKAENREVVGEMQSAFAKRNEATQLRKSAKWAVIGGIADAASQSASLFKPGG